MVWEGGGGGRMLGVLHAELGSAQRADGVFGVTVVKPCHDLVGQGSLDLQN